MSWHQTLARHLATAGWSAVETLADPAVLDYLRLFDDRTRGEHLGLIQTYLEAVGPRALERRDLRKQLLSTISIPQLRRLAAKTGLSEKGTGPELSERLSKVAWSWNSEYPRGFCEAFDITEALDEYWATLSDNEAPPLPSQSSVRSEAAGFFELHTYQSQACDDLLAQFKAGKCKSLLQLPTGGGKTRTALHFIARYLRAREEPSSVLWLAYEPLLAEQAARSLPDVWPFIGPYSLAVTPAFGAHTPEFSCTPQTIIFGGVQSVANAVERNSDLMADIRTNVSLIVFDEAHKVVAPVARELVNRILHRNSSTKLLGLTATPGRGFDVEENISFVDFFDSLVSIRVPETGFYIGDVDDESTSGSERPAIRYLQEIGVLARLRHTELRAPQADSLQTQEQLTLSPHRNNLILDQVEKLVREGNRTLIFACSVRHCEILGHLLRLRGIKSGVVLGSNLAERSGILHQFRHGDLYCLITFEVLTTGFDAPELDALVVARAMSSPVTYSQILGRALRGPLNGGHEENQIINVSSPIFTNEVEAYKYFSDYWS